MKVFLLPDSPFDFFSFKAHIHIRFRNVLLHKRKIMPAYTYMKNVSRDGVKLVTAMTGKPKGPDEQILCTVMVNGRPQSQCQIPHPHGNANEKDFARAAEYLAPRIPTSVRGWKLENGMVYEATDSSLVPAKPVSASDLGVLVCLLRPPESAAVRPMPPLS
jgi:hypothetical protein